MVINYKGGGKNKEYNSSKASKYHIKTFSVCNSTTGNAYNVLTYFGSETSYDPQVKDAEMSEKIFQVLLSPLGKGHHVYADQYYTTYQLLEYKTDKEFYYTGKLQIYKKNIPKEMTSSKIASQEVKFFISERGYMCVI